MNSSTSRYQLSKTVTGHTPPAILILGAIAVAGLYVAIWLLGDAVWELKATIETLTETVANLQ